MSMRLNGATYYWTAEACRIAGISKNTFIRWVKEGSFADVEHRDRRGWRLFTEDDLDRLKAEVNKIQKNQIAQNHKVLETVPNCSKLEVPLHRGISKGDPKGGSILYR